MEIIWVGAGLGALFIGGEGLVRGAVASARRLGVSPLLIGLVIVGFGTSTPELVTSLEANLAGSPGIAIGNVVGSNTANILLILGIAAVIGPIAIRPAAYRRDAMVAAFAALVCLGLAVIGMIDRLAGVVLLVLLFAYMAHAYRSDRREVRAAVADEAAGVPGNIAVALALLVGGIALTVLGAHWVVEGAIALARSAGLSESIIGLSLVAVGTSLPELTASVAAALRRQGDLALGNILGSNIFNVLGILGVTALVRPLGVPAEIMTIDVWVMLAATALLLVFARSGWRLCRPEGWAMLALYGGYSVLMAVRL